MKNLTKIASYQKDIERLNKVLKIYNETENLNGGFHNQMVDEISHQIKHCEKCISNLKKYSK